MKKLLTLFSAFVLGSGSVFGVASCTAGPKHDIDEDPLDGHQDLEILNQIKAEVKQTFEAWWDTKATVDINDYPDQRPFLTELVDELKKENDGLILTSETISKYRFLTHLFIGFKAEFVNLNQDLQNRYSNYYVDSIPLFLDEDDILFTLYNINFDKIAKLLNNTSHGVLGITVEVNLGYEIRFKGLQSRDNIKSLVVITNNLDVLGNMQDKIEEYFTNFVNDILEKQKFQIILERYINSIDFIQMIGDIIIEILKNENILFSGSYQQSFYNIIIFPANKFFLKEQSVLAWADENYNSDKLTPEKFSTFYKKTYLNYLE